VRDELGSGVVNEQPSVIIELPLAHWNQIVSDIENMCGQSAEHIEILRQVTIMATVIPDLEGQS
jgi:hypothetical protein